ncbi:MAG: DUF1345 domain-containing protein [Ideonella sp.]|nr:DUF1345 domain-containing protein [Ideonella sp.]MCC7456436.1 DUF1345 domain-containing protein [Nitrospira sp.]
MTTPHHPLHDLPWSARISGLQRQALAVAVGLAAAAAAWLAAGVTGGSAETPWLAGWLGYSGAFLGIAWQLATRLDAQATRRRAQLIDPGARMLFMLVAAVACASIVAVALAVETSRTLQGPARWGHIALAMLALAASWLLLQTVFALHYAREYYRAHGATAAGHEPPRGLAFPGAHEPDYLDFLYFSTTVGMTSQVSDVAMPARSMRRLVLAHGLLSFAFNLIVLALAVNVFAASIT